MSEERWFEQKPANLAELRATLRHSYPSLHVSIVHRKVRVSGTFAVIDVDRYNIDIALPDDYPASLPSVWETGGRIERIIERHVFPKTEALCLGVPIDLWIRLDGDFSIANYLEKAVRPYLIGNSLVEEGQPWPFDESAHGSQGVAEFYQRYLGMTDPYAIGRLLLAVWDGRIRGHWPCPCGSGHTIRKCHQDAVRTLRAVPRWMLSDSVDHMIHLLKAAG